MTDPVTLEVMRHRLQSIADEMELTLLKSAYSSVVKEGLDASAALFDAQGQTIAQAAAIPIHLGTLIPAVAQVLKTFPRHEMREGDIFILNDPYQGGTHLPDLIVTVPVIYEGQVVALSCSMCHHQEMGGKTPGSVPPDATELYQEGLIIPPLRLYRAGQPDETLHAMIARNVRIPDVVLGDIRAQIAAGNVGQRRLLALFQEYGLETVLAGLAELMDRAEAMTRRELEQLPGGSYSFADWLDNDGIDMDRPVKIQVTVTIKGSNLHADFAGTSPQVKGPFNSVPSSTMSAVYYIVRAITDPTIPNNAGCYRPVTMHLPEGSIVNPRPPAPVNSRAATIKRLADVLLGALIKAAPQRLPAAGSGQLLVMFMGGIDPATGRPYVTSELGAGGMGARPNKDGIDAVETDVSNCMNIPAEAIEMEHPIRILKSSLRHGSAGAGRYRGGLGLEKVFELVRGQATVTYRGERHHTRPWGLFGGLPAEKSRATVTRSNGTQHQVASKETLHLDQGDRIYVFTPGGAGYGDPLQRAPEAVLEDVLERRISLEAAAQDYGVVIDRETMTIDAQATERRRAELARDRGPITWTYDRGPELGRE